MNINDYSTSCEQILGAFSLYYHSLVIIAGILYISLHQNQYNLVYSLDDAYIHMAMAKNFALHGIWGITGYEFTSCSSSILWTLFLSLIYLIFQPNEESPLILNIVFSTIGIIAVCYILLKERFKKSQILFVLISLIFITPIPPLIFTGLEHVLHIFVTVLFIYFVSEVNVKKTSYSYNIITVLLSVILPLLRYEGLILVAEEVLFCY